MHLSALLLVILGTAPAAEPLASDTLRDRVAARATRKHAGVEMGAVVHGYLSSRGLPPREGEFAVTDSGLVFRSADGGLTDTYPLVGRTRSAAVSLAYVHQESTRRLYVFRLDGGVFQTEVPGPLLDLAEHPEWGDSLTSYRWVSDRPLVSPRDTVESRRVTAEITSGAYADSLYALFGRPGQPVGQVGPRGRRAGRLGEYLAGRDSLALDPARMISRDQLRHTLAHELGHRWQARAPRQLAVLWQDVAPIRDPRRYGHGSDTEHQAEAIAFAVHFLQTTAGTPEAAGSADLLEQYERMVPGTATIARYLALQPIYSGHPLRAMLTGAGRP